MLSERTFPEGYLEDAQGRLIPVESIKDIDRLRDGVVLDIAHAAMSLRTLMQSYKEKMSGDLEAFVDASLERYDVAHGGKKGNVSLLSFDGKYKVILQRAEGMDFDEGLQGAKMLIDACILDWSKDSSPNVKALIMQAFEPNRSGRLNFRNILKLRNLNINDERWQLAMQAISDAIRITDSKSYLRIYERREDGKYEPIALDFAQI